MPWQFAGVLELQNRHRSRRKRKHNRREMFEWYANGACWNKEGLYRFTEKRKIKYTRWQTNENCLIKPSKENDFNNRLNHFHVRTVKLDWNCFFWGFQTQVMRWNSNIRSFLSNVRLEMYINFSRLYWAYQQILFLHRSKRKRRFND